jgi:hypothetical protein
VASRNRRGSSKSWVSLYFYIQRKLAQHVPPTPYELRLVQQWTEVRLGFTDHRMFERSVFLDRRQVVAHTRNQSMEVFPNADLVFPGDH